MWIFILLWLILFMSYNLGPRKETPEESRRKRISKITRKRQLERQARLAEIERRGDPFSCEYLEDK